MNQELTSDEYSKIANKLRDVQDFPKAGIVFKDITPLLGSHDELNILMSHLVVRYKNYNLDFIAGIDARGFIFGSILADRLGIGFVPIRKKGKLPYDSLSTKYELEYGFDEVEVHTDAFGDHKGARVRIIDDLMATGGTAKAACELVEITGAICVECCFIIELEFLNGKQKLDKYNVYSVMKF
jgi:adenine phosphoribosyltransferase